MTSYPRSSLPGRAAGLYATASVQGERERSRSQMQKQQRNNRQHAGAWLSVEAATRPGLKSRPRPLSAPCGCGGRCYPPSQMSLQSSLLSLLLLPLRGE